ncbi:MAG TPA: hypothetical protein VG347_05005 [Verrucomicrobiae bacterium]|nr:hypothetical protein [Verrucomicrobiae bacterium]
MKAEEKELFRKAILRVLDANRTRFGLSVGAIALHLSQFGFNAGNCDGPGAFADAIQDELDYLKDKQLAEEILKIVSRENRAWKITPSGIAFVDERG